MNTNISNFFSNPEKFLNQSKILKETINDLIDMNANMEKQLDENKLIKLNKIVPFQRIKKESRTSDFLMILKLSRSEINRINHNFFYLLIRYITILLLLNEITSDQYKQLATKIKIVKPDVDIPEQEPKEIVIFNLTPTTDELVLYLPVNTGKQNDFDIVDSEDSEDINSSGSGGSKIGRLLFNNGIRGFVRKGDKIYIMKLIVCKEFYEKHICILKFYILY
jgi:hypothetical protein